jgi:hypothetical protein
MARVEVITGSERRRRWSEEQKRAIVTESPLDLSNDIRNCTGGDAKKCTTLVAVGSRFEPRREA